MESKNKIMITILVIAILIGGWRILESQNDSKVLQNQYPTQKGICGPNVLGADYNVSYCDNSCMFDADCQYSCGCGAISKNEACHIEGIVFDCVNHEVKCTSGTCVFGPESIQSVLVSTDKTEYAFGETAKITVKNNLGASIWDFASCPSGANWWRLEQLEGSSWKYVDFSFPTFEGGKEICGLILCEKPEYFELKSTLEISQDWQIGNICQWSQNYIGIPKTEPKTIDSGIYRIYINYGLNNESGGGSTSYSNEFAIKS